MRLISQRGFTLLEMLVVITILGVFSTLLVINFRSAGKNASARMQTANVVISDIRKIQSMAIAGATYQGSPTCGFGIEYVNTKQYRLYVREAGASPCKASPTIPTRNRMSSDPILETRSLINANMAFKTGFDDIFFEIPDPTTYINNNSALNQSPARIEIHVPQNPSELTIISVFASGKIDTDNVPSTQ